MDMFTRLSKKTGMRNIHVFLFNARISLHVVSGLLIVTQCSMFLFYVLSKSEWEIFRSQADRRDRHLDVSMPRDSSKWRLCYIQ